ncbi:serine protease, subtilase family (plasmid) [Sinorhizobium americanum CCGM7]|uniref:S8 family serine peptidase n=1 Tax=Sinorhizobium americanum TaxID=194963 RepID=UPI0004D9138F|nr:S8 family serine peptidase [Sinorhizobium americanum]APG86817.1 serine protease, subtilase family [Sinorhizobium americanum CCGM7]
MRMRTCSYISCVILAAAAASTAYAQSLPADLPVLDPPSVHSAEKGLGVYKTVRGIVELLAETRLDLARSGNPLYYKNSDTVPKTLKAAIAEECGEQPDTVTALITKTAINLNGLASADDEIAPGEVVAIPFCLRVETDVPVEVKPGDSPSSILLAEYGVSGPKTLDRFYKRNIPRITSAKIREFTRNLEVGKTVVVPFASEERVFVEDTASDKTLQDIVTSIDNTNTRSQLESVIAETERAPDSVTFRLDYVPSVTFSGASRDAECRGTAGQTASVVDRELLRARFAAEMEKRAQFFGLQQPEGAVIGLVDSGVNKSSDSAFFSDNLFHINFKELNSANGEDNDDNEHKDDIFGTNFYQNSGIIDPLPKGPEEAHGTKMASLILGGPDLGGHWFGQAVSPPIRLKVINFSSLLPQVRTVDATKLKDAIEYLKDHGVGIVNLSLATSEKLVTLKNSIRSETDILFIVAAGNSKTGMGNDLNLTALFPARYGGRTSGNDHVVTVGAHDLSGALAKFSNFSAEFVDLLAPGCAVRVRSVEADATLENGTSAATAITSFAAGLIRTLGVQDPADIKNRLLVGTDFVFDLKDVAWSSGRLNVLKAISVFHDAVEMKGNDGELIFGTIDDLDDVYHLCQSPPQNHDPAKLRKVVFDVNSDRGTMIEFWIEVDDKLTRQIRCEQVQGGDASLSITLADGQHRVIALGGVREIVLATMKMQN